MHVQNRNGNSAEWHLQKWRAIFLKAGLEKIAKKKFEEELAKNLNDSLLYSHQKEKTWKKDINQRAHEGIKRTTEEEKDIAKKLNDSFISDLAG